KCICTARMADCHDSFRSGSESVGTGVGELRERLPGPMRATNLGFRIRVGIRMAGHLRSACDAGMQWRPGCADKFEQAVDGFATAVPDVSAAPAAFQYRQAMMAGNEWRPISLPCVARSAAPPNSCNSAV